MPPARFFTGIHGLGSRKRNESLIFDIFKPNEKTFKELPDCDQNFMAVTDSSSIPVSPNTKLEGTSKKVPSQITVKSSEMICSDIG